MKQIKLLMGLMLLPVIANAQSRAVANVDPFEPVNRVIYSFNDVLDRALMTPAARIYMAVTPNLVEKHVDLFFANLGGVTSIANSFAQFKIRKGVKHLGRFTLNSTVGLLGIFDVATPMGLVATDEDFGQTMAVWGIPAGPYMVLPLLGPSTLRDTGGLGIDSLTDPMTYYPEATTPNLMVRGFDLVATRAGLFKYDALLTGDRYQMMRDLYLQSRIYDIQEGDVEDTFGDSMTDDTSDFLDESF